MSASREKKQRQGGNTPGKSLTAKQKANTAKRKTIQYTVIGVVCAILVAALLIWDNGFIQRGITAVTVGNTDYSTAEVSYYYHNNYQSTLMMSQYGMVNYDTTKAPKDQVYSTDTDTGETTSYADYFRQSALDQLVSITALYEAAVAEGYTEADVKETVDQEIQSMEETAKTNGYASFKQMLIAYYGKLVTPSVYRDIVTRQAITELYQSDYTDSLSFTDDELSAYYDEHADDLDTYRYSYLYYTPAEVETIDSEGNQLPEEDTAAAKEEAMAAAKATADAAAASLKEGKDLNTVLTEQETATSSLEEVTQGAANLNEVLAKWLKDPSRQAGDIDVLEYEGYGYYVAVFEDRYLDETPSANVRHILVNAELPQDDPNTEEDESSSVPTDEQMAAAKAEAENLLTQWRSGEATNASFGALADEHSDDGRDEEGNLLSPGGLYEKVYAGNFVTNFDTWLFDGLSRKAGDTDVIENNGDAGYYGYHAVYFVGYNDGDFSWKTDVRNTLTNEAVTKWQEELEANITTTEQSGMKFVK